MATIIDITTIITISISIYSLQVVSPAVPAAKFWVVSQPQEPLIHFIPDVETQSASAVQVCECFSTETRDHADIHSERL